MGQLTIPSGDINELTHKIDVTRYTNYPVKLSPEAWEDIQNCCVGSQDDEEYVKMVKEIMCFKK